jgi:hypothetical protein
VVVCDKEDLIVVSARADLDEIMALAMNRLNEEKQWMHFTQEKDRIVLGGVGRR